MPTERNPTRRSDREGHEADDGDERGHARLQCRRLPAGRGVDARQTHLDAARRGVEKGWRHHGERAQGGAPARERRGLLHGQPQGGARKPARLHGGRSQGL